MQLHVANILEYLWFLLSGINNLVSRFDQYTTFALYSIIIIQNMIGRLHIYSKKNYNDVLRMYKASTLYNIYILVYFQYFIHMVQ